MKVETLVELVYDASKNASPEKADMYEKILGGFQVGTDTSSLVTMGHDQASNTYQCRLAKGDTNNNDFQRCVQRFYRNGQHQKIALRY